MSIEANAGIIPNLYINTRCKMRFTLYINVFATFLKDMLTEKISNTSPHIEKSI